MSSKSTSDFRRYRKACLIAIMGNKCCICGYNKCNAALEFHHLNPDEKGYGIGAKGTTHKLESDLEEIQKCILVCANCHREIENNLYDNVDLQSYQYYDKELANELLQSRGRYLEKIQPLQLEEIEEKKRKRALPRPNREELKELVRNNRFVTIGEMYGVTDDGVRKWCSKFGLPTRMSKIKEYSDEEWDKL